MHKRYFLIIQNIYTRRRFRYEYSVTWEAFIKLIARKQSKLLSIFIIYATDLTIALTLIKSNVWGRVITKRDATFAFDLRP